MAKEKHARSTRKFVDTLLFNSFLCLCMLRALFIHFGDNGFSFPSLMLSLQLSHSISFHILLLQLQLLLLFILKPCMLPRVKHFFISGRCCCLSVFVSITIYTYEPIGLKWPSELYKNKIMYSSDDSMLLALASIIIIRKM